MAQDEYRIYLQSPEWRTLAREARRCADHRCQLCNSAFALNVHHRTYARLFCERLSDLVVLCATCHTRFHDRLPKPPEPVSQPELRFAA
jgi:5-methylcytosine-specific restriction endonuclease McrA